MITFEEVHLLKQRSHHEADTRVVRHVSLSERPVVVDAMDTDIFVLLVYAFSKVAPANKWYKKIDKERYVDLGDVCRTYGKEVCDVMPAYHSLTQPPYKVGKVKPFKKMVTHNKFSLLSSAGILLSSLQQRENMLTFMQTLMYPGKDDEDYVETRIRMYIYRR